MRVSIRPPMSWMKYLMILPSRTLTTIPADISLDMCQFIVGADNCLNLAMSPCVEPGCSIRRTSISRSIVHQESQNYLVFFIDNICRIIMPVCANLKGFNPSFPLQFIQMVLRIACSQSKAFDNFSDMYPGVVLDKLVHDSPIVRTIYYNIAVMIIGGVVPLLQFYRRPL
jgi:hypothetical protein